MVTWVTAGNPSFYRGTPVSVVSQKFIYTMSYIEGNVSVGESYLFQLIELNGYLQSDTN